MALLHVAGMPVSEIAHATGLRQAEIARLDSSATNRVQRAARGLTEAGEIEKPASPGTPKGIARVLGGRAVFPLTPSSMREIAARVQEGLPVVALQKMAERYGLPLSRLAAVLGIPSRTLARRLRQERLTVAESDRLARLARVFEHASAVFAADLDAGAWMAEPHWLFNGQAPLDLLATDAGAVEVERELGRIEHGIPA